MTVAHRHSGGHPIDAERERELTTLLDNPEFSATVAAYTNVDCDHDIPYGGGSGTDWKTIYWDRRLSEAIEAGKFRLKTNSGEVGRGEAVQSASAVGNQHLQAASQPAALTVIRHGTTALNEGDDGNSVDKIRGWSDVKLSPKGVKEAQRLALKLKSAGIKIIIASDLSRARQTADIIGKAIGVTPVYTMKLRPWDLGEMTGQATIESLPKIKAFVLKPDEAIPEGESFNSFKARAFGGLREAVAASAKGGKTAIVTHHRVERLIEAWTKAGQPADHSIDLSVFLQKGEAPSSVEDVKINAAVLGGGQWDGSPSQTEGSGPSGANGKVRATPSVSPAGATGQGSPTKSPDGKEPVDPRPTGKVHEAIEGTVIHLWELCRKLFGWPETTEKYPRAHDLATVAERHAVAHHGWDWDEYQAQWAPLIHADEKEAIGNPPDNLLLDPYVGSPLYAKLAKLSRTGPSPGEVGSPSGQPRLRSASGSVPGNGGHSSRAEIEGSGPPNSQGKAMAGVSTGGMPQAGASEGAKLSHAEVKYGMAKANGDRCDKCEYYKGRNNCDLVEAPIYPAGWCTKFEAKEAGAANEAPQAEAAEPEKPGVDPLAHGRAIAGAKALHAVGHIDDKARDKHIAASQKALGRAGQRKAFGSWAP